MIKHKGNIKKAIESFKNNNNAIAFIYKNASFSNGVLSQATITLKDLFATQDAPTQASSKILKNFNTGYDATIVQKLKKSGAAIIAKTHMDELALGGTGGFSAFGPINNRLDSTRIVGGSSSGAVATFNKYISIAIASDTGDSIRLPASYNGIIGFKPSYGAVSRYGLFPFSSSLDTIGWFAHNIEDIILVSQVLFGKDLKDFTSKEIAIPKIEEIKPKKIAFLNMLDILSPEINKQYNKLINNIKKDQIIVEEVHIDKDLLDVIGIVYDIISFSEASSNDANLTGISFGTRKLQDGSWKEVMFNTRTSGLGHMVQKRFTLGSWFLLKENQEEIFLKAQKVRRKIVKTFNQIYEKYDILIYPTTTIAPKIKDQKQDNWYSSFLSHNNFEGTPSISIPFAYENNLPVGLSIDSKIYSDKKLLSYSLYLQKMLGEKNE